MHAVDIIIKKKSKLELTKEEIVFLVNEYTSGNIPDYQMSAFLMAVCFCGMTDLEATYLALAMRDSGDVFDLSAITGTKVDKHSTGGVGDKVTLILGPLVAYHGAKFAKMSGRGLGHTGGTIDKLESIPGYLTELSIADFKRQVEDIGLAIVGQSGDIAPADKKLYALRDVTGTVDSIPLIAASVMSKKLASGADAIVLDVKFGSGAFMKTISDATKLATLMVSIGNLAGKKMTAILTNMDEPLGFKIGNGLEVYEAIETLSGNGPSDLVTVVVEIGSYLLLDAQIYKTVEEAKSALIKTLDGGLALAKFKELVKAQKGDLKYLDNKELLIDSAHKKAIYAEKAGYVLSIDALAIGRAAMELGAGRKKKEDKILFNVGIDLHKKIGDQVTKGELLATLYHLNNGLETALEMVIGAIKISNIKKNVVLIEKVIR